MLSRNGVHRGVRRAWLAAVALVCIGTAGADESPRPLGPDPQSGFRPIGEPIRVEVTDQINPLYMRIHFTVGELRKVDSIAILDRTTRRELHRFTKDQFASQIQGASPDTVVTFGKNITFRNVDKRPEHVIMVTAFNENNHPVRGSAFAFRMKPHPSETLTGEVSFQTFFDIAQIDFEEACQPQLRRGKVVTGIFIGEEEQEFPSLRHLTAIQTKESLRGYFEGCVDAYKKCLGRGASGQESQIQNFCTEQRQQLHRDVFGGK